MKPTIGIVMCGTEHGRQFVSQPYIQAVSDAGAVPVIIPCTENVSNFPRYYAICDGFLFCGGDDVSPRLFGEDLLAFQGHTDIKTDTFHLSFMKYVLSLSLPLLCICRGMQVLNIALGGSIYQDISLRNEPSQNHMQLSGERSDVSHKIFFSLNSMLYNICGDSIETNSFHHQCIKTPGKGLTVAAVASDGIIEALESTSHPFLLGVQWHPECMYLSSPPMKEIFSIFVNRAKTAKELPPTIHFT